MTLKQIIEENLSSLVRSMDPSFDLLGRLRSVAFVKDRISLIKQQSTDDQKNDALLSALLEVPDDIQQSVMNGFISALRSSGQDHVANIFQRENDKVIMSDEHYELLSTRQSDLCEFMNPRDGLVRSLISLKILSEIDKGKVFSKTGIDDMAEETVNILMRKSDYSFGKFVDALKETNQSHVSYLLTGVGNPPMSDEHRRILRERMHDLENFMDTENGLLVRLISQGTVSLYDAKQIRSITDPNVMARELVEVLLRKPDDAFHKFITLLRETGQSHVAYILTGEGKSRPLKEEHRSKLLSGPREYLVKTIDSKHSGLVTALMSKGVFSSAEAQRVTSVRPDTQDDRNEMILDLIARKSQSDFFKFISALNDSNQTHVVVELIGADIVGKIKTVYESGTQDGHIPDVDAELLEYMREMFQRNGEVVARLNEILTHNGVSVSGVREGCIAVTFTCKSIQYMRKFRDLHRSGELENLLNEAFCSQFAEKGLKSLKVEIPNDQFEQCAQTFVCWIPMTSKHREALLSSAKLLVDKMTVSDALLDKLSLCKRRRESIESAATREQQVKTLIDIVSRQSNSAFTELLNALKYTQQTEAADIISGSDIKSEMEVEDSESPKVLSTVSFENVDYNLEYLLNSITSHELSEDCLSIPPTVHNIWFALRGVVMSIHNLRVQLLVPTSSCSVEKKIDGKLEHMLRCQQSFTESAAAPQKG